MNYAESTVHEYITEHCVNTDLSDCLQKLALAIRDKLPYSKKEYIEHYILLIL